MTEDELHHLMCPDSDGHSCPCGPAPLREPMTAYETITYWASRIVCHFGIHTLACRGRVDHDPHQGRWITRW